MMFPRLARGSPFFKGEKIVLAVTDGHRKEQLALSLTLARI